MTQTINVHLGAVYVQVTLDWRLEASPTRALTPEMKREALLVAESLSGQR